MTKFNTSTCICWNIGFVIIYIPIAVLSANLAIPPGNVTPIFPAAGLAFAAYLLLGKQVLPGIFLGGMLGNLLSLLRYSSEVTTISAALFIGFGEVLANLVAAAILLRYVKISSIFQIPHNVILFFAISLFWLVSPTIGVSALALHGLLHWDDFAYTWLTWWLGDSIGVMLVAPVILLAGRGHYKKLFDIRFLEILPILTIYILLIVALELTNWPIAFLLIPVSMLLVLKLEIGGAVLASTITGIVVVSIILTSGGLYWDYELNARLLLAQLLIGTNTFTVFFLAAHVYTIITLARNVVQATHDAEIDPLTGLYNRRGLKHHVEKIQNQTRRDDSGLTLLLIDIDNFKNINDSYGHDVGDTVLVMFARVMKQLLRSHDLAARVGGEEFIILLTTTDRKEQEIICQRIQSMVYAMKFDMIGEDFHLTVSGGVSDTNEAHSLPELIALADKRLYIAKRTGKNQFIYTNENVSIEPPIDMAG